MRNKEAIHRKHHLHVAVVLALAAVPPAAYAAVSATNGNFTMLSAGSAVGGTNDVVFTWDGTLNTSVAGATSNATISSVTPFFSLIWTAYNVKIYGPGSYTIPTTDTAGAEGCPTVAPANCASGPNYSVTVADGQVMAHMKFAWGGTEGIDVIDVWVPGNWNTLNSPNPIFTGPGGTYAGPVYGLLSIDWDNDGEAGGGMVDGPFPDFSANFNVNTGGATTIICRVDCEETKITAPGPSTGGGCSIGTASAGTAERADWWIVAGFLAWLGMIVRRQKLLKNS